MGYCFVQIILTTCVCRSVKTKQCVDLANTGAIGAWECGANTKSTGAQPNQRFAVDASKDLEIHRNLRIRRLSRLMSRLMRRLNCETLSQNVDWGLRRGQAPGW